MEEIREKPCGECKRRGEYIIHLLGKQNVVMGLNEQDLEWLRKLGINVGEDEKEVGSHG